MAKIDAAFQAAPDLGPSSYDPIQFARRNRMEKFQIQRKQQEDQARSTAQGLENLMVDVKGWEDQQGFKEIMADQDRVMNGFLELSRKGMNLVSPKTTQEILAYKAIQDAHAGIRQKVDVWNQQKSIYDLYQKAIEQDSTLHPDEQKIDREATMSNIQKVLKSKDILSRGTGLQNLIVSKPEIGDVDKYINEKKDQIPKPDMIGHPYQDENGQTLNRMETVVTPQKDKEIVKSLRNLYKYAPERIKNAIQKQGEINKGTEPVGFTDEDRFIARAYPQYQEKFVDKAVGQGGGINFNFGPKVKLAPGERQDNSNWIGGRNYDQRYDFKTNGGLMKVQTTGGYQHDSDPKAAGTNTAGVKQSASDGWHEITGGDYAEAELLFYDPKSDQLVFRTGQAAKNPWIDNNITFSVPRKNVPDAEKLPIMVDGKKKTLKDVISAEGTSTTPQVRTIGGKDFRDKPYIPKKK